MLEEFDRLLKMPIANCIITPKCQSSLDHSVSLINIWSKESKLSSEHMTVNLIESKVQLGNNYNVMANLLLPSMWSRKDISSLQIGLANALAQYFSVTLQSVHVVTSIINSGLVVEGGKEITW